MLAYIISFILSVILSIEADFVQTKQVALMNEPQVSTGHLIYRAPDYIQWAYITPHPVVWEMDGEKTNVNPQVKRLLRMRMASIAGQGQDDAKMQKESKRVFRSVKIIMDEQNEVAQRVELVEKNGDTTIIEFTNVIKK